jgi:hypothetical protein
MVISRTSAAVSATLAVVAVCATAASARIPTTVTIDTYANGAFSGSLHSTNQRCVRKRAVTVFMILPGSTRVMLIGTALTDAHGAWTLSDPMAQDGDYGATAAAKTVKGKKPKNRHKKAKNINCAVDSAPSRHF